MGASSQEAQHSKPERLSTGRSDLRGHESVRAPGSQVPTTTDHQLDPHQFAYRATTSVDDALALALHRILQHHENDGTYSMWQWKNYRYFADIVSINTRYLKMWWNLQM